MHTSHTHTPSGVITKSDGGNSNGTHVISYRKRYFKCGRNSNTFSMHAVVAIEEQKNICLIGLIADTHLKNIVTIVIAVVVVIVVCCHSVPFVLEKKMCEKKQKYWLLLRSLAQTGAKTMAQNRHRTKQKCICGLNNNNNKNRMQRSKEKKMKRCRNRSY